MITEQTRRKRICALLLALLLAFGLACPALADYAVPRRDTPDYRVAFYAFDCYNMQDSSGTRSGYGYEMMQNISNYMQCTFSYVGYEKTADECIDMLRSGELDIYTAARLTPERQVEFAYTSHPAITATTCMNIKSGNTSVVSGDYSTYEGLRIGLLARHTYNEKFLAWANEKGFSYTISYYETQTELSRALVDGEVDALVYSYIGTPKDEISIETFGQTPYYIIARKEDQALIKSINAAIDQMSIENPNWRTELYNKYYGTQPLSTELTLREEAMLSQLRENSSVIVAVADPDGAPYSEFYDGSHSGIVTELFAATAERLGLEYKFIPVTDRSEYLEAIAAGDADVWVDAYSENPTVGDTKYRSTDTYLSTSVSVLRERGASNRLHRLAVVDDSSTIRELLNANWPEAETVKVESTEQCVQLITSGEVDGALLLSYTAQKLARDDIQNRLRVDIVPGAVINLCMAVNANDDRDFYGLWSKTLSEVSAELQAGIVQDYVEEVATPTFIQYLFDHPTTLIIVIAVILVIAFLVALYRQSPRSSRRQKRISDELAVALEDVRSATAAKNDFFSKMSHDIRTPLNVVLGMTQIAQKYKNDPDRLSGALDSITSEGNYLLVLINSILDVNQLEHGHMELNLAPFDISDCLKDSLGMLIPLAEKKDQQLTVSCDCNKAVVIGDSSRFSQIIINIVSNAIKYTDNGGRIDVSLSALPNDRYRFVCRDNGIGMSPEFVGHITEEYVRAEDSRVSKTQGTGLGMSVVKGFTDLMSGTLSVESEPGKGSTFTVALPLAPASDEQRKAVLAPQADIADMKVRLAGKRVLLAEDNTLNAEIAIELLESIGLAVDWAENGRLAVERFEASAPNGYFAIFMDMQMPVMDGIEATAQIRSSSRSDHSLPIFAMTANTFAADKQRCREAGMSGYIAKPINVDAIVTTLAGYADGF